MKEQINRYARGAFEYDPLFIQISPEAIEANVENNRIFRGRLHIVEAKLRTVKGIVYSLNDRVRVINDQFIGADNYIDYEVDAVGTTPKDELTGCFVIVSNGGEEKIPYNFHVEGGSFDSSMGNIKNLFHFTNLCQSEIHAAGELFAKPGFNDVFLSDDLYNRKLHDMLLDGTDIRTSVEEFLVSINKKQKVTISLSYLAKEFDEFSDKPETVVISKDTWGYTDINIWSDAEFLKISAPRITDEDFIGGKHEYTYTIDREKLHAGINYGVITFKTVYQTIKCEITVKNSSDGESVKNSILRRKNVCKLVDTYLHFKLHKININDWISESKEALEVLLKLDETDSRYGLIMAQVLITEKKVNEARFYLDTYKDYAIEHKNDEPVLFCYYLYVNTIFNRDRAYAKETSAYVKNVYEHECSDWRILWILLYLDEEMAKNKSLKLLRIKEQYNKGMRSPVLLLEACAILNDQPMLLRMLNEFEVSALLYGCREGILDKRLISQVVEVVKNLDGKYNIVYKLLSEIYKSTESDDVLSAICALLIRNGCTGRKYITWYETAIEHELKITKLFEYYLESCERNVNAVIPKMVILYFAYDSVLSDETRAYLYANIIVHKTDNLQIYRNYAPAMEEFAFKMLSQGKNDKCLGIIYSEFLKESMIGEANASNAAKSLLANVIVCHNPNMVKVCVGHKETTDESVYELVGGEAIIPVYTEDTCICFMDMYGRRFAGSIEYSIERIYEDTGITNVLYRYVGADPMLTLSYCDKHRKLSDSSMEIVKSYYTLANNKLVCDMYKNNLLEMVVDYFYDNYEGNELSGILEYVDVSGMSENSLAKYVEALLVHGFTMEAFEKSKLVRTDKLNPKRVLRLCERINEQLSSGELELEPDDRKHYIKLAYYAFLKGKYSEVTLSLFIEEFNRSTGEMTDIWRAAIDYKLNTYPLDERIIVQMLFSRNYSSITDQVFAHYYENGANERVVEAYIAYNAYNYFVKEAIVSDTVFDIIEARIDADKDIILVCRLAFLKFLSEKEELRASEKDTALWLMKELLRKGYIFAFYKKFEGKIPLPYEIADKTIIEHRANPKVRSVIHYYFEGSKESSYINVDMKNMYEGVFVKDFVLFYADAMQYYITEETDGDSEATIATRVENTTIKAEQTDGRFDAINDILTCRQMKDSQTLAHLVKMYGISDCITEQLFKPL